MLRRSLPKLYNVITHDEAVSMPWQNDAGLTKEYVRIGGKNKKGYDLRVSLARVGGEGEFSVFGGYTRCSYVTKNEINIKFYNSKNMDEVFVNAKEGELLYTGDESIDWYSVPPGKGISNLLNVLVRTRGGVITGHKLMTAPSFMYYHSAPECHMFFFAITCCRLKVLYEDESSEDIIAEEKSVVHFNNEGRPSMVLLLDGSGIGHKVVLFENSDSGRGKAEVVREDTE
eukprot:TRINITY_DN3914_c0_g8_i1.p1 TRINITY_DN3914_c0_g8~~TRINITY_DN3914_c0_g8_i1.p1  ORF type:complete len:229 (+),score=56.87 TRINITY_DN3914_c0_g8_i1:60-746(+)